MIAVEFRPSKVYDTPMSEIENSLDETGQPVRRTGRPPHGRLAKKRMTLRLDKALDRIVSLAAADYIDQIEDANGSRATGEGSSTVLQAALEQSKFAVRFAEYLKAAGL